MTEKLLHDSFLLATGVLACGMLGCFVPILGQWKWIAGLFRSLPPSTRVALLALAVGLTLVGATKTNRTGSVSGSLLSHSQTSLRVNALTSANIDQTDTARFLDIDVATNGTVLLVAHRPPAAATVAQDVVVVATTNLCTPTWFALTNTAFAVGETNLSVALARPFLLFNSISNLGIFVFCDAGDSDGDGLDGVTNRSDVAYVSRDGVHWRETTRTVAGAATNAVTVSLEQLTGLSDVCRSRTVILGADGVVTTNVVVFDRSTVSFLTTASIGLTR